MSRRIKNQAGFSLLVVVAIILVLMVVGFAASRVLTHNKPRQTASQTSANQSTPTSQTSCPATPTMQTPVDLSKVSGILYPGQYRGNEYKAHGAFRFDNFQPADITVKAPLDAHIERASRYVQNGDVQILLEFTASCGISYRFDHILKVAPQLQALIDALPAPTSDSHTTVINPAVQVKAGDTIAIAVGSPSSKNIFVDFGVYDMTKKNKAASDPTWLAKHQTNPNDQYGICWFDLLPAADAAKVKSLPAASSESGKTSDYCK